MPPYSDRWTFVSTKPGTTNWPAPSIVCAPAGTGVDARGPTAAMRPSRTTTTALATGGPPLPSITVAPVMARTDGWARMPAAAAAIRRAASMPVMRMPGILSRPDQIDDSRSKAPAWKVQASGDLQLERRSQNDGAFRLELRQREQR